ncbi:MAG: SEL1-like repeat protein, partial [Rhodomicrobium sp.]
NAIAQDSLGDMYNYGKGVPQNQAEAEQWYRLAAKQGLAKAQNDLEKRRRFALCAPRVSHKETPRVARVHALIRL